MLARDSYSQEYIDRCRARMDAQRATFREFMASHGDPGAPLADSAFETMFFNNLVIVLDALFAHRTRAIEGKDGNPLNEVRVLAGSLMNHAGTMTADRSIRLDPAASVLGYADGETITILEPDFARLEEAFFDELQRRFV